MPGKGKTKPSRSVLSKCKGTATCYVNIKLLWMKLILHNFVLQISIAPDLCPSLYVHMH
jgi:hypothetical protein